MILAQNILKISNLSFKRWRGNLEIINSKILKAVIEQIIVIYKKVRLRFNNNKHSVFPET
jgi:hypothetical protein